MSRRRYAWRRFVGRHLPMLLICLMVATLIAVVLAPFMRVIRERFERKTVWGEIVHVCALEGHPTASQAYAWSSTFDSHALMAKRLRHLQ